MLNFWGVISKIVKFHASIGESMYLSKHGHGNQLAFHRHENFFKSKFHCDVLCFVVSSYRNCLISSTSQTIHSNLKTQNLGY